jgi:hypothetical protein
MRFLQDLQTPAFRRVGTRWASVALGLTLVLPTSLNARAEGPLAAHVEITPLNSYSEGKPLPKPQKILVYDFEFDPKDVQVDKTQEIRPRHIIARDENPKRVGENAAKTLSAELVKDLAKTGLPVQHASAHTVAPDNTLIVKGSFASLKQGVKTERVIVGLGSGSAAVSTHIRVLFKTAQGEVVVS